MNRKTNNPKHQNQIRIIGGSCRGRKISFPSADGLRPTPDMVRERLFNWLGQDLTGWNVLDLFAGSGALGLEAASRNAKQVILVEQNRQVAKNLQGHAQIFRLAQAEVYCGDAFAYLKQAGTSFDLVFLDPPFAWQAWKELFGILQRRLKNGGKIYIEAGTLPDLPTNFVLLKAGKSGMSRFLLLEKHPLSPNQDE
ncbi:MAG: 16S rRNA (guanine(966)-N(2))-methyltransferase RsmD [Neisseria sp.]|nr:16S rRNA (guanine(966)-N(2))-methyltransferase RsmD [Neisseria sp.]